MKRIITISLLAVATALPISAQRIVVTKGVINCGNVLFGNPVTAQFELRNRGAHRLRINQVEPDCGCTMVDYPKKEISSNTRFNISAIYDAQTMGHFEKSVAVYSNGSKGPVYLTMKGVVVSDLKDYTGTYPIEMGDIRLDKNELEFDDVNSGDRPIQELQIMNIGSKKYMPTVMHLPAYLTTKAIPEVINPGHKGTLLLTLDSRILRNYGLTQTKVYMSRYPGDKVNDSTEVDISAVILPNFKNMTNAQRAVAPKIKLSTTTLNLGKFGSKDKLSDVVEIENTGKSVLNISSLQMFSTGMDVTLNKSALNPGESAKLKITVHKQLLKAGKRKPRVLMITNDPANGKVVITINVG